MVGRPRKHDRSEIAEKLHAYVDGADIPVIAEFCYTNNVRRQYLYEMAEDDSELSDAIKRCIEKKEAQLEKKALHGDVNPTMAIFSLKQIGWRDKQEHEHSGKMALDVDIERMDDGEILSGIETTLQAINDLQKRIGTKGE